MSRPSNKGKEIVAVEFLLVDLLRGDAHTVGHTLEVLRDVVGNVHDLKLHVALLVGVFLRAGLLQRSDPRPTGD
jgi:hypothetical protein